jgi:hypothetical protein
MKGGIKMMNHIIVRHSNFDKKARRSIKEKLPLMFGIYKDYYVIKEIKIKNLGNISVEMNILTNKITLGSLEERIMNLTAQTV